MPHLNHHKLAQGQCSFYVTRPEGQSRHIDSLPSRFVGLSATCKVSSCRSVILFEHSNCAVYTMAFASRGSRHSVIRPSGRPITPVLVAQRRFAEEVAATDDGVHRSKESELRKVCYQAVDVYI